MKHAPFLKLRLFAPSKRGRGQIPPKMTSRKHEWSSLCLPSSTPRNSPAPPSPEAVPDSDERRAAQLRQALADVRRVLAARHTACSPDPAHPASGSLGRGRGCARLRRGLKHEEVEHLENALVSTGVRSWKGVWRMGVQERVAREEAFLRRWSVWQRKDGTRAAQRGAAYLRRLIASSLCARRAYASLMEALSACGDGGVKQLYRELRMLLHKELNAEPAPETTAFTSATTASARTTQSGVRHLRTGHSVRL